MFTVDLKRKILTDENAETVFLRLLEVYNLHISFTHFILSLLSPEEKHFLQGLEVGTTLINLLSYRD